MNLLYPVVFGVSSGVIAAYLGFELNELNYWLVSGPCILAGSLLAMKG